MIRKQIFLVLVALCAFSSVSYATDYTTMDNGSDRGAAKPRQAASSSSQKTPQEECTRKDKQEINTMSRKVNELRQRNADLSPVLKGLTTEDSVKSREGGQITKEVKEITGFVNSKEYKDMKPVYERCGVEMPTLLDTPFWAQ